MLNDEIERFLFGRIDKRGADAVRAWVSGNPVQVHRGFQDFFEYMDAQKLRTPKGLDWILRHYKELPQVALMGQMQALRQMHATMWSECVREIVSARSSQVKFLVSDHPVTIYHRNFPPDAVECQYPCDPGLELVGSQTLFAMDANHCLILTHLEYAEDPAGAAVLSRRTNARFRGSTMGRTDAFIRERQLNEAEVHAINLVIKSRARKYVGAANPAWLTPDTQCKLRWEDIGQVLLPKDDLWKFGGETYIKYEDGSVAYRDAYGRTSKAHEYLAKKPPGSELAPDDPCGCGGGLTFVECCAGTAPHRRPSWNVMSIRERNVALLRGVYDIFDLSDGTEWIDVRRNLSDDQVRRVHELFAALWPLETQLTELLPRPQNRRSRALYLGMVDPRTLSMRVTGLLPYVDELVLIHPFVNANSLRPEYNPLQSPAQFRAQTLRSVLSLLILEGGIRAGRVHLIPDPLDYDTGFRDEILAITKEADRETVLGPIDEAFVQALGRDERMRAIKRLPPDKMKEFIRQELADDPENSEAFTDKVIDGVIRVWARESEADPLAVLDPFPASEGSAEFSAFKGFSRETGLFVATLTGAFVYTDSDTQWARLHESDGVRLYEPDPSSADAVRRVAALTVAVPTQTFHHVVEPTGAREARELLRRVAIGAQSSEAASGDAAVVEDGAASAADNETSITCRLRASMPLGGFQRVDVSRLVLTFGRLDDVAPVRTAFFIQADAGDRAREPPLGGAAALDARRR